VGAVVLRNLVPDLKYYGADRVTILASSKCVDPIVAPVEARGYDVIDYDAGKMPGQRMAALDAAVEGEYDGFMALF